MVNLQLYAWVVRGRQRIAIIKAMSYPMSPSQICKKSKQYNEKTSLNNTSDVLRNFVRMELAACLNAEAKSGRIYELTDEGEEVRKVLMEI